MTEPAPKPLPRVPQLPAGGNLPPAGPSAHAGPFPIRSHRTMAEVMADEAQQMARAEGASMLETAGFPNATMP